MLKFNGGQKNAPTLRGGQLHKRLECYVKYRHVLKGGKL